MFYSQHVLAKKGMLAKVWLAAHWDSKLTKAQILATDISKSVESILKLQGTDKKPLSLRLQAHLLLGLVRIYVRQVKYLMEDCNVAVTKLKNNIRDEKPGKATTKNIDLQRETAPNTISLRAAENSLPDTQLPDFGNDDEEAPWVVPEGEITMQEGGEQRRNDYDNGDDLINYPEEEPEDYGIDGGQVGLPEGDEPEDERTAPQPSPARQERKESSSEDEGGPRRAPSMDGNLTIGDPTIVNQEQQEEQQQPKKRTPKQKKRRLDEDLGLTDQQIKNQIKDASATVREVIPAPPSKKAMLHRQSQLDGAHSRLRTPVLAGLPSQFAALLTRNMVSEHNRVRAAVDQPGSPDRESDIPAPTLDGMRDDENDVGIDGGNDNTYQDDERVDYEEPEEPVEIIRGNIDDKVDREETKALFKAWFEEETEKDGYISFFEKTKDYNKADVSKVFSGLLHLKTAGDVDVKQDGPYQDILVYDTRRDL